MIFKILAYLPHDEKYLSLVKFRFFVLHHQVKYTSSFTELNQNVHNPSIVGFLDI